MIITVKVRVIKQESDYYDYNLKRKKAIICVKTKENVTLREFFVSLIKRSTEMKQAKHFLCLYIGNYLKKSELDQTLENLKFRQDCCCAVEITDEFKEDRLKLFDDSMIFNVQDLSGQQKQGVESESRRKIELKNKNNWPLLRIIIGIVDLLLLLATITTFLLFFLTSLNVPIVALIAPPVLLVFGTILFFGWNTILPDNCLKEPNLGIDINEECKNEIKGIEKNKDNNPKVKKKDEKEKNKDN